MNDARRAEVGSDKACSPAIREARCWTGADALLMIHGYNYTFRDAVARAAQVKQWLETDSRRRAYAEPVRLS